MKLDHLQTFLIAAELLNFSQAARQLNFSQSAVSQQIRELEEDLALTLFERRGRGVLLTPAGERLRMLATPILRDINHVRADLSAFQGLAQGVLRIGASATPGVYLMPHALGHFAKGYPGVRTSLTVGDTESILTRLQEGELDVALVEEEPAASRIHGWEKAAFWRDELVVIVSPRHAWGDRDTIAVDELLGQPIIFRQQSSRTRQLILDRLSDAGVSPESLTTRFELGNTEGIKHAVMADLGVGFVPRQAAAIECRAGLLHAVELDGVSIDRTFWLLKPPPDKWFVHLERFCEALERQDWLPEALAARPSIGGRL